MAAMPRSPSSKPKWIVRRTGTGSDPEAAGVSAALGIKNQLPGVYFNKTKGTAFYTPDLSQPAYFLEWLQSGGSRVTWQASNKNKVSVNFDSFQVHLSGGFKAPAPHLIKELPTAEVALVSL